jgi:hypothetical protein
MAREGFGGGRWYCLAMHPCWEIWHPRGQNRQADRSLGVHLQGPIAKFLRSQVSYFHLTDLFATNPVPVPTSAMRIVSCCSMRGCRRYLMLACQALYCISSLHQGSIERLSSVTKCFSSFWSILNVPFAFCHRPHQQILTSRLDLFGHVT